MTEQHSTILRDTVLTLAGITFLLFATRMAQLPYFNSNDGLFDVLIARAFPAKALEQVAQEVKEPTPDGEFITRFQASWLESFADKPIPVNLDGEPIHSKKIRYEIIPGLIRLTVPEHCPCIKK